LLKVFRLQHREKQIREQSQRNQANNDVFHSASSEFLAAASIELTREEKNHDNADINQICHALTVARLRGDR
jgi:hypothetical protein